MRVVFMGTPDFAAQSLAAMVSSSCDVCAVYTQPPRKAGRGQQLRRSPVHELALLHDIDVFTPSSLRSPAIMEEFAALKADIGVVVAYGQLLPPGILDAPQFGCINVHASLLPRWRGAAPIQRAIMAGDRYTGVQVMQMEAGLDTGPILFSTTVRITTSDTFASLHDRLAKAGAGLLPVALNAIADGAAPARAQSSVNVTHAPKIKPVEARIDWRQPARVIDRHTRGLSPFPGAWTEMPDRDGRMVRIKVLETAVDKNISGLPGEIMASAHELHVACGEGGLVLKKLQRDGKVAQSASTFLQGFPLRPGHILL